MLSNFLNFIFPSCKRKEEILNFFKEKEYYFKDAPFPYGSEDVLVNENKGLIELVFLSEQEQNLIKRIFNIEEKNGLGRARNTIISLGHFGNKDKVNDSALFKGQKLENLDDVSFNIAKYKIGFTYFFQVNIHIRQCFFKAQKVGKRAEVYDFVCLVKEIDLGVFRKKCHDIFCVYSAEQFKLHNNLSHFD